jgi:plasmid maintenance system antidote protein VapI
LADVVWKLPLYCTSYLKICTPKLELGINQERLSQVLNEHRALTPEIAYRLSVLFKPSGESGLRQQASCIDIWQVKQHSLEIHVIPFDKTTTKVVWL